MLFIRPKQDWYYAYVQKPNIIITTYQTLIIVTISFKSNLYLYTLEFLLMYEYLLLIGYLKLSVFK
jgi:hypothetical protein